MPSQPNVSDPGRGAFTTTDEGAHVLNGYAPGGVEQIIVGLATPVARRELPPEDLALPSEDVLTRMNNNCWSASGDSGWSKIAPQRDWMTVVTKATGTFSGEMAMPDGTVIPGTGKSFELTFSTTARWGGDQLVEEYVFWDSALMGQQIGLA
jgi:hypothetical protein